jgi:hypothetical protein
MMLGVVEVPLIALLKKMVTMGGALQTHLQNKSNQKYQDLRMGLNKRSRRRGHMGSFH